jgi:aminoglycoside phosphotransferase (APT) family kinase protein
MMGGMSTDDRPAGRTTHEVCIDQDEGLVVKRFRPWDRGEPAREWAALTLLAESAPGLAPAPVRADLDGDPPAIVMSWLPGAPLGTAPLSPAQADALALAVERLWRSVPPARVTARMGSALNSTTLTSQVRAMAAAGPGRGQDPLVGRAWQAGVSWLDHSTLDSRVGPDDQVALGQGDCNLANFLWDGTQVRLVDFEDSGPSDRAFELAMLVEHISAWSEASLDADIFLGLFEFTGSERARLGESRRLAALFWLILLLPGGQASDRNPPGTLRRQASRLLALLGW